jgi:MinD superfamily P-loop ATPase
VDAADLHLVMAPEVKTRQDFTSGHRAVIDPRRCTACGVCIDLCRWQAISADFAIDPIACEGCGVCYYLCPERAVDFPENTCGEWFVSDTRFGPMVHARLGIAEENSGKLVTLVRQEARRLAESNGHNLILTDGPPGIGCPVIAAIGGADAVLIVTEPTVSGIHDLQRVASLADHFKVPAMISVNKYDLNLQMTAQIESFARGAGLAIAGNVPFDPLFTEAMVQGQTIFEQGRDGDATEAVRELWQRVCAHLGLTAPSVCE